MKKKREKKTKSKENDEQFKNNIVPPIFQQLEKEAKSQLRTKLDDDYDDIEDFVPGKPCRCEVGDECYYNLARLQGWFEYRDKFFTTRYRDQQQFATLYENLYVPIITERHKEYLSQPVTHDRYSNDFYEKNVCFTPTNAEPKDWYLSHDELNDEPNDGLLAFKTSEMLKYGSIQASPDHYDLKMSMLLENAPKQRAVFDAKGYVTPFFLVSAPRQGKYVDSSPCKSMSPALHFEFKFKKDVHNFIASGKIVRFAKEDKQHRKKERRQTKFDPNLEYEPKSNIDVDFDDSASESESKSESEPESKSESKSEPESDSSEPDFDIDVEDFVPGKRCFCFPGIDCCNNNMERLQKWFEYKDKSFTKWRADQQEFAELYENLYAPIIRKRHEAYVMNPVACKEYEEEFYKGLVRFTPTRTKSKEDKFNIDENDQPYDCLLAFKTSEMIEHGVILAFHELYDLEMMWLCKFAPKQNQALAKGYVTPFLLVPSPRTGKLVDSSPCKQIEPALCFKLGYGENIHRFISRGRVVIFSESE